MNSFAAICTYLFILSDILNIFECKVGFHKDMSMDIAFPPVIKHTSSSAIPLGHLRPLGKFYIVNGLVIVNTTG